MNKNDIFSNSTKKTESKKIFSRNKSFKDKTIEIILEIFNVILALFMYLFSAVQFISGILFIFLFIITFVSKIKVFDTVNNLFYLFLGLGNVMSGVLLSIGAYYLYKYLDSKIRGQKKIEKTKKKAKNIKKKAEEKAEEIEEEIKEGDENEK